jgi:hypothetical protein
LRATMTTARSSVNEPRGIVYCINIPDFNRFFVVTQLAWVLKNWRLNGTGVSTWIWGKIVTDVAKSCGGRLG